MKKASIIVLQLFCLVILLCVASQSQAQTNSCTYTLNPDNMAFSGSGGSNSFSVTASDSACTWRTVSNADWISVTSSASSTGNGVVNFNVAPNTGATRTGTISAGDQIFTIHQAPAISNCVLILSAFTYNAPATGATGSISITTPQSNCTWTASTTESWITLLNANGTGSGVIRFSVAPNPGADRMGFITVGGHFIRVSQLRFCPLSLQSNNAVISANGGTGSFVVVTPTLGCNSYINILNSTWFKTTDVTPNGDNSRTVFFSVDANLGGERQDTITVLNHDQSIKFEFTITQTAASVELITVGGRVITQNLKPVRGALVTFVNPATGETKTTTTNPFGYFHFSGIERGRQYNVLISHKRYKFSGTRAVTYFSAALIPIYQADVEQ